MTINGDILLTYKDYVTGAFSALWLLVAAVIGVFLAFAIANMLRHFIMRIAR